MIIDNVKLQSAYDLGYESMQLNIKAMGFNAANSMFNDTYPVGKPYTGSREGYYYTKGEFAALLKEWEKRGEL
jgi:hypothetical protein